MNPVFTEGKSWKGESLMLEWNLRKGISVKLMAVIEPWASSMAVVEHKPPSIAAIIIFITEAAMASQRPSRWCLLRAE